MILVFTDLDGTELGVVDNVQYVPTIETDIALRGEWYFVQSVAWLVDLGRIVVRLDQAKD